MGRDQGPHFTRHGLMGALALSLVLLSGCGGQNYVQVNASGASSTAVSAGGSARFPGSSTTAALFSLIFLAGVSYESERGMPRSAQEPYSSYAPEPDPARRIAVQDCTRPIEDWSANLRCR